MADTILGNLPPEMLIALLRGQNPAAPNAQISGSQDASISSRHGINPDKMSLVDRVMMQMADPSKIDEDLAMSMALQSGGPPTLLDKLGPSIANAGKNVASLLNIGSAETKAANAAAKSQQRAQAAIDKSIAAKAAQEQRLEREIANFRSAENGYRPNASFPGGWQMKGPDGKWMSAKAQTALERQMAEQRLANPSLLSQITPSPTQAAVGGGGLMGILAYLAQNRRDADANDTNNATDPPAAIAWPSRTDVMPGLGLLRRSAR